MRVVGKRDSRLLSRVLFSSILDTFHPVLTDGKVNFDALSTAPQIRALSVGSVTLDISANNTRIIKLSFGME